MSTYHLQLLNIQGDYTVPHGPIAYVALKTSSDISLKIGKREREFTVLTPECISTAEFETNVDSLIKV